MVKSVYLVAASSTKLESIVLFADILGRSGVTVKIIDFETLHPQEVGAWLILKNDLDGAAYESRAEALIAVGRRLNQEFEGYEDVGAVVVIGGSSAASIAVECFKPLASTIPKFLLTNNINRVFNMKICEY